MRPEPRRLVAALGAALALSLAGAGCRTAPVGADDGRYVPRRGELRVGVVADSPPYVWREGRRWKGVEPDFARALAKRWSVDVEFRAFAPGELFAALLDDQIDLAMAGIPLDDQLRTQVEFAPPYLTGGLGLAVRPQQLPALSTPRRIQEAQMRLAIPDGDEHAAGFARQYLPRADLRKGEDLAEALQQVSLGLADAALGDAAALHAGIRRAGLPLAVAPVLLEATDLAWAFRPGQPRLREELWNVLEEWKADGTLREILRAHIPVSP